MTAESARNYKYVEGLRGKPWSCRINIGHEYKPTGEVRHWEVEIPIPPYVKLVTEIFKECIKCGKKGKPFIAWEKDSEG